MKYALILAVPMMIEIFQERVKMVSAGNHKQKRSVPVVGTLWVNSVNHPVNRYLSCLLTMRSLGGCRQQTCGCKEMAYLQQPNNLRTGLAAPEGYYVTTNRFVQKSTLVLIGLQAQVTIRNRVISMFYIHARWGGQSQSIDFQRRTAQDLL